MGSGVLFGEITEIVTGRSAAAPVPLDSEAALLTLGSIAEALVVYDSVTILLRGPALEAVPLIRWLGEQTLSELLESGAIRFAFCPGVLAFLSEHDVHTLRSSSEPGVHLLVGQEAAWADPQAAFELAIREQTQWSSGKARRWARRLTKYTHAISGREVDNSAIGLGYSYATRVLGKDLGLTTKEAWRRLDNRSDHDQSVIRALLAAINANLGWILSSLFQYTDVYGNDTTWDVMRHNFHDILGQRGAPQNLDRILKYEGYPDLRSAVASGLDGSRILALRRDPHSTDVRQWLQDLPETSESIETLRAYREAAERAAPGIASKILRVGITSLIGSIPVVGTAAGSILSVLDSVWGDKVFTPWSPRVYIQRHLRERATDVGKSH